MFETNKDVLDWYEKQPRTLTREYISSIEWSDVKRYPLNEKFVPVLRYMRDVETLTDLYYQELLISPTGKDPVIRKFLDSWGVEEITHGEVLNRFLEEAGYPSDEQWASRIHEEVPLTYTINTYVSMVLTKLIGKNFTAAHMTYGAVNEFSTLQGYRRLEKEAGHPVLSKILKAIMHEESFHAGFYYNIAKLELQRSEFAQKLARFVVDKFWTPVGEGAKRAIDSNYVVRTLFGTEDALMVVDKQVTQRIRELPGFDTLTKVNEKLREIVTEGQETVAA